MDQKETWTGSHGAQILYPVVQLTSFMIFAKSLSLSGFSFSHLSDEGWTLWGLGPFGQEVNVSVPAQGFSTLAAHHKHLLQILKPRPQS